MRWDFSSKPAWSDPMWTRTAQDPALSRASMGCPAGGWSPSCRRGGSGGRCSRTRRRCSRRRATARPSASTSRSGCPPVAPAAPATRSPPPGSAAPARRCSRRHRARCSPRRTTRRRARWRGRLTGRAISLQTFHITPKIAEWDAVALPEQVVEVHPELALRTLAPATEFAPKKSARGAGQRIAALARWVDPAVALGDLPAGARLDDVLDALAVSVVGGAVGARGGRGARRRARRPRPPDARGLSSAACRRPAGRRGSSRGRAHPAAAAAGALPPPSTPPSRPPSRPPRPPSAPARSTWRR